MNYTSIDDLIGKAILTTREFVILHWKDDPNECLNKINVTHKLYKKYYSDLSSETKLFAVMFSMTPTKMKRQLDFWLKAASILEPYIGQTLKNQELLKIFGFSPKTYVSDTNIVSCPFLKWTKEGYYVSATSENMCQEKIYREYKQLQEYVLEGNE